MGFKLRLFAVLLTLCLLIAEIGCGKNSSSSSGGGGGGSSGSSSSSNGATNLFPNINM